MKSDSFILGLATGEWIPSSPIKTKKYGLYMKGKAKKGKRPIKPATR
jgi:hypothetical protein